MFFLPAIGLLERVRSSVLRGVLKDVLTTPGNRSLAMYLVRVPAPYP